MRRVLDVFGRGLAAAGLAAALGWFITSATSSVHNPPTWPYWLSLATLAIGGVLFVFGQRKVPAPIELNDKERLAMGLLMTDPNAASRGAWLYPLHQDLTYRGLSDSEATSVLAELVRKKAIECVEVPVDDPLTGRKDTAPAYRLTPVGADLAAKYADVPAIPA